MSAITFLSASLSGKLGKLPVTVQDIIYLKTRHTHIEATRPTCYDYLLRPRAFSVSCLSQAPSWMSNLCWPSSSPVKVGVFLKPESA